MSLLSWVAKWLTRGYARTMDLSGVSREEVYRAEEEERKVFWVDTDDLSMAGQCTPFGTILLNEDRLGDVPDEVVDYVFLHEVGHTKPPAFLVFGSYVIRLPLMLFAIFGIPVLFFRGVAFALSVPPLNQFITLSVAFALVVLLILAPVVIVSWLDEGYAELFALSKLGEETYLRRHNQMEEHSERGVFSRVLRGFLYPRPAQVIRFSNWLDGRTLWRSVEFNSD